MGLLHYYTADDHEIAREGRTVEYRGLMVWVLNYCHHLLNCFGIVSWLIYPSF